jgi:pre-mRNA-splicing factor SYF1
MQTCVKEPSKKEMLKKTALTRTVQDILYKNTKAWSFYVDLEESLGTVETTKAAYNRMIDLKIVTPQIILNFASFLEENKYFEEGFRAYERGVATFKFPYVKDIWMTYLTKFIARYGAKKLERARDLFEQVLEKVPATEAKVFYMLYSELEEKYGLTRHAMSVLDRATAAVDTENQLTMYHYYLSKAEEYYGATKTREIYERGIELLPDAGAADLCLKYAEMEQKLGEIDRSRALFIHGSQFCNPRTVVSYWRKWEMFEVAHGNEDTFKDMLRIKRTVSASFSTVNEYAADTVVAEGNKVQSDADVLSQAAQRAAANENEAPKGIKRKADVGGAIETDMEALERAVNANKHQ